MTVISLVQNAFQRGLALRSHIQVIVSREDKEEKNLEIAVKLLRVVPT